MLVEYGASQFEQLLKEKEKEIVFPENPNYKSIIKDIAEDFIKRGVFTVDNVFEEVLLLNHTQFESIANIAIDTGNTNYFPDNDLEEEDEKYLEVLRDVMFWYFGTEDTDFIYENMMFEAIKEYQLPLELDCYLGLAYEDLIERFSKDNWILKDMYVVKDSVVAMNSAQQLLFDEDDFAKNQGVYCGMETINLYYQDDNDNKIKMIEG